MDDRRIFSYEPIAEKGCRILILGSMPSVKSLEAGFYYAHPRNVFWPMMAEILGGDTPRTQEEKRNLLISNGIALWDAAKSCVREGSLDAAMKDVELNDFGAFFEVYPTVERVLFNGGTAWRLYHRLPEGIRDARERVLLPSTSPAHTMKYEVKLKAWREAVVSGAEVKTV